MSQVEETLERMKVEISIKAMELCRPLPRLGDFRRELLGQIKEALQKGGNKSA